MTTKLALTAFSSGSGSAGNVDLIFQAYKPQDLVTPMYYQLQLFRTLESAHPKYIVFVGLTGYPSFGQQNIVLQTVNESNGGIQSQEVLNASYTITSDSSNLNFDICQNTLTLEQNGSLLATYTDSGSDMSEMSALEAEGSAPLIWSNQSFTGSLQDACISTSSSTTSSSGSETSTSTSGSTSSSGSTAEGLSAGAIAGIVIGTVLGVALIAGLGGKK
jgi:hypothetical protein